MKIGIIGAGMAGLSCGTRLAAAGHDVVLFDKGRGPGGRMATRRAEIGGKTLHFDHGAQYFTVSDDRFAQAVADWAAAGVVAPWPAASEGAFVGTPGMNAPVKAMAARLDVRFCTRIEAFGRSGEGWRLDGDGAPDGVFDAVLVAVPAEQAAPLLALHAPAMAQLAGQTVADPCWTIMVGFAAPLDHGDTLRQVGAIGWAARNCAKPGRTGEECWVVQASPEWSRMHLEEESEAVATMLLDELREQVGGVLPPVQHSAAHRWRFAFSGSAGSGGGKGALWDMGTRIGACGDWLIGPRVEAAFVSGIALADMVIDHG